MPSYFSHYLVAKKTMEKSGLALLSDCSDCFILGAQGGDLLFYAFGQFKGYGARTHKESTCALFNAALGYCRKEKRKEPLVYSLGLLCHYALDSIAHPYILHESETRMRDYYPEHLYRSLHMMLETRLDRLMLKKTEQNPHLKEVLPTTSRAAHSLADVWHDAIDPLFSVDVPYRLLCKLPSRMYRYQKVFLKPRCLSCAVLKIASKKLGYPNYITGFFLPDEKEPDTDFANENRRAYPAYVGSTKTKNSDFYEMAEEAVQRSLYLINEFMFRLENGGDLPASLFEMSFAGFASGDPRSDSR